MNTNTNLLNSRAMAAVRLADRRAYAAKDRALSESPMLESRAMAAVRLTDRPSKLDDGE